LCQVTIVRIFATFYATLSCIPIFDCSGLNITLLYLNLIIEKPKIK